MGYTNSYAYRALKPVKKLKKVLPRVCATCRWGEIEDGGFSCGRENGYRCDAGDMTHWFRVCEYYQEQDANLTMPLVWENNHERL